MSYGVTNKGFITKPNSQILEEMNADAESYFGERLPTDPESIGGQILQIVANASKRNWDLTEAVADTSNRERATGVYLDFLADIAGIKRQLESGSKGDLLFFGQHGTLISANTVVKDFFDRNVLTLSATSLDKTASYQARYRVPFAVANTDYKLTVLGTEYTYNSGSSPSTADIANNLANQIDVSGTATCVAIADEIHITYITKDNLLSTVEGDGIALVGVGSLVYAESAETGADVNFSANTLITLVSSILGIDTVTNPYNFSSGRDRETDAELRLRMAQQETITGTATKPSIESSLGQVDGVSFALVVPNRTLVDDTVTGVPAKHFETFVGGGDEQEIAQMIWDTMPALSNTHGDISKTITDHNGDAQSVSFSRPSTKYAWVEVTYEINSEEVFPEDGEDRMKTLASDKGNSMYSGEDFDATKMYAPLYQVQGMYVSQVRIAVTTNESDTPVFQTARIPVAVVENLLFDVSRVVFA